MLQSYEPFARQLRANTHDSHPDVAYWATSTVLLLPPVPLPPGLRGCEAAFDKNRSPEAAAVYSSGCRTGGVWTAGNGCLAVRLIDARTSALVSADGVASVVALPSIDPNAVSKPYRRPTFTARPACRAATTLRYTSLALNALSPAIASTCAPCTPVRTQHHLPTPPGLSCVCCCPGNGCVLPAATLLHNWACSRRPSHLLDQLWHAPSCGAA